MNTNNSIIYWRDIIRLRLKALSSKNFKWKSQFSDVTLTLKPKHSLFKWIHKVIMLTFIGREEISIVTVFFTWQNDYRGWKDSRGDSSGWLLNPSAREWQSWKGFQMSLLTSEQQNCENFPSLQKVGAPKSSEN